MPWFHIPQPPLFTLSQKRTHTHYISLCISQLFLHSSSFSSLQQNTGEGKVLLVVRNETPKHGWWFLVTIANPLVVSLCCVNLLFPPNKSWGIWWVLVVQWKKRFQFQQWQKAWCRKMQLVPWEMGLWPFIPSLWPFYMSLHRSTIQLPKVR